MSTGRDCQPAASVVKDQIMLYLCVIVVFLETVIMSPTQKPVTQILLSFLAAGYALAMASIFVPGTTVKALAARLSVASALVSAVLVMTRELGCKVQTFHCANET
uniref:Uncharacterized protein n=1 Tax=Avena sativa TaxID=4498 RepID=A0ACD5U942_AVESA